MNLRKDLFMEELSNEEETNPTLREAYDFLITLLEEDQIYEYKKWVMEKRLASLDTGISND